MADAEHKQLGGRRIRISNGMMAAVDAESP
jgi:hypothetical protein